MEEIDKKNDDLFILYSKNRIKLKKVKKDIEHLSNIQESYENKLIEEIQELRKEYYKSDRGLPWIDWITCLEEFEIESGDIYKLAQLWDKKHKLNIEGGRIRKLIYHEGMRRMTNRKINEGI